MKSTSINIFQYYSLTDFLHDVQKKKLFTRKRLSESIGITPQAVGAIFMDQERLVINHVTGWKRAFGFKRIEGMYFELLAIMASFATSSNRPKLRDRALGILKNFIDNEVKEEIPNNLIYWLCPECSILRNLIDLDDFPKKAKDIPDYAATKVGRYRKVRGYSHKDMERKFSTAWKWLKKNKTIYFDKELDRFEKTEPMFFSEGKLGTQILDLQSAILTINHSDAHIETAMQLGSVSIIMSKVATLPLPIKLESIAKKLSEDFLEELVECLNSACNIDEMTRLKTENPEKYKKMTAFLEKLDLLGIEVPEIHDTDFDALAQMAFGIRRITNLPL